jgi:phage terminase large subunit-like protein
MTEAVAIKSTHPRFDQVYKEREAEIVIASDLLVGPSLAERFARLTPLDRRKILDGLSTFERARLLYAWDFWCRPKQREPTHHPRFWLIQSGRDFGKNMTASQWLRRRVEDGALSLALIGPTLVDIAKYQLGGESGLFAAFPPHQRPVHREDKRLVLFPSHPRAVMHVITAEEPEWRGGNVDTVAWDEFAKSKHREKLLDNLEFNLRSPESGLPCQALFTTTPLDLPEMKELLLDPECYTVIGDSRENAANMDRKTLKRWEQKYGGTRKGQQEMGGRVVLDNPNSLFKRSWIELARVDSRADVPELVEIAVAVDPGIATNERNDPTAYAVGGIDEDGEVWIWHTDANRWTPEEWGDRVITAHDRAKANVIVGERNRGGDLVAMNVRAAARAKGRGCPKIVDVNACRGKDIRADPVAGMAERGELHFVGVHPETEAELTDWNPKGGGRSPNRLDAVVWLAIYLAKLTEEGEEPQDFDEAELDAANEQLAGRAPKQEARSARPDHYELDERRNEARGGTFDDGGGRWGRGTI